LGQAEHGNPFTSKTTESLNNADYLKTQEKWCSSRNSAIRKHEKSKTYEDDDKKDTFESLIKEKHLKA
jgi:hypothetical protein